MSGTIEGRVVGAGGQPVPEASVMIGAGPEHPDIAALTDDDGRFQLGGLAAGTYSLVVNAGGGTAREEGVVVSDGAAASVEVRVG
jgi:iron complex outermembrane receptor protein